MSVLSSAQQLFSVAQCPSLLAPDSREGVDPSGCHLCSIAGPLEDTEKVAYYVTTFVGGVRQNASGTSAPVYKTRSAIQLGCRRVSKADGRQVLDVQRDALLASGGRPQHLYEDLASGRRNDRPGLAACLKALQPGDVLLVWQLDRLGCDLRHLINTVYDLTIHGIGLKALTGHRVVLDTVLLQEPSGI